MNLPALSPVVLYGYQMSSKRDHSDFVFLCSFVCLFVFIFFLTNLTLLNDIIPSGKEC